MAEPVKRKIKLPDGSTTTVRVPSDWDKDQIKQALVEKGVMKEEKGVLQTVWDNVSEVPSAVARGVERGTEEVLQFYGDLREAAFEDAPILRKLDYLENTKGAKELKEKTGKSFTENLQEIDIPDVADDPSTPLGQLVKGASQFGTGWYASPVGRGGSYAQMLVRGAMADMSSFDPNAENVSSMIEKYPALQNPITEALATDPNDNEWVNRLRNAAEGVGITIGADALIKSVKGVKKGLTNLAKKKGVKEKVGEILQEAGEEGSQISAESRMFREQLKGLKEKTADVEEFTEEGVKRFGDDFRPVAESLYRSLRSEAGEIGEEAARETIRGYNPDKLATSEDIKEYVDELQGQFGGPPNEPTTWGEIKDKATKLGMTDTQIERLGAEASNWKVRFRAAEDAMLESLETTQQYAVRAIDGTPDDLRAFYEQMARDAELLNTVSGVRSEAGRLLNSLKMMSEAGGERKQMWEEFMDRQGGEASLRELARQVTAASDPTAMRKLQRRALREPSALDVVIEGWKNWGLLSGPQTHVVNFASNAAAQLWTIPEEYATWMIGKGIETGKRAFGGGRTTNRIALEDANAFTMGFIQASKDSLLSAGKTFASDDQILQAGRREIRDELGKIELEAHRAWSSKTFAKYIPNSVLDGVPQSTKNKIGKGFDFASEYGVRLPGKALYVGDAFWKTFGYRTKLNELITREARNRVQNGTLKKEEVGDFVQRQFNNPSKRIHEQAMHNARYTTFTKELGSSGKKVQAIVGENPGLHFAFPFIRTPINIIKYAGERTPLGLASRKIWQELRAGGVRRDAAMAKMLLGTSVMYNIFEEAVKGNITGGAPMDPEQRANFYASGRQPYSVRMGDQMKSYSRIEPFATMFGIAANFAKTYDYMTEDEREKAAASLVIAASDVVIEKTFMQGASDIFAAMRDPQRYGDRPLENIVGTMAVPNLAAQYARTMDPYLKDVQELNEAVMQRVPGLREQVVNRVNIWGEDIDLNSTMWNPFWSSDMKDDPLLQDMYHNKIQITKPERQIAGVNLSPKLYREYVKWGRQRAKQELDIYYNVPEFRNLPVEIREERIKKVVRKWDERSRKRMTLKIKDEIMERRVKDAKARTTPEREKIEVEAK